MKIENTLHKPYEESVLPSISFEVEISYTNYQEAIIGVNGWLKTDDKKIVASLNENTLEKPKTNEVGAKGTQFDSNFKEAIYKIVTIALLDRQALNHIEKRRMINKKGDINLILCLNVKYIESKAVISPSFLVDPKNMGLKEVPILTSRGPDNGQIIVYAHDPGGFHGNRWIISGKEGYVFLSVNEQTINKEVRIPSTDWLHDYAPKLELGEYFIVEIPIGKKIIEEAWSYIEKAEECFRRWDTKGAYGNCREAGNLLDRTLKEKLKKDSFIYKERWGRSYERFNSFASLGLHLEDIKKSPGYPPENVIVDKADVEHILVVTKALIKYAEELLEEGK